MKTTVRADIQARNHTEALERARELSDQYFGKHPYRVVSLNATPHISNMSGAVVLWCVEVEAEAA